MDLHLVSDATGEMLNTMLRAGVAQFDHAHVAYHHWTLVRSRPALDRVMRAIRTTGGLVFASIVDASLRKALEEQCACLGIKVVVPLDPVLFALQEVLGERAAGRPGKQYVLDDAYFRRIEAMDFVLAHDDGQTAVGLRQADLVLVGLSRSSKTPTSFYLANRGVKVANVPLIREVPLPADLFSLDIPVVGLSIDPRRLVEIRRNRLRLDTSTRTGLDMKRDAPYIDYEQVAAEVQWARRLCRENGWPMIDVTHRSIEETAAAVLARANEWAEKAHPEGHGRVLGWAQEG